ncbi:MAG TPA: hypothetical protein VI584_04115 [Nitrospiria bacterium]|nr:hypothetical protein [Nitrospiria bacterium]
MKNRINVYLLGLISVLALSGCGNEIGGSGQCGGAGDSGACVKVESITPTDTTNVDAFRTTTDCNADGTADDPEPFTDHNATVSISNTIVPNFPGDILPDVTLTNFRIEYRLNFCPAGFSCPNLISVNVSETLFIPADGSLTADIKFVDLEKKFEFQGGVSSPSVYPSYSATYTFTGTDIFQNNISVSGSTEFTIGDYDNC